MRVAVIGAGAAGLCAVKCLVHYGHSVVCYERGTQVGGTWIFDERKEKDKYGLPIHSSMYKFLKTNLPKEVMAFPDFPFPELEESFIRHEDVLEYLVSYCDHFHLRQHIKFEHYVTSVTPTKSPRKNWLLTIRNLAAAADSEEEFDAVFVCCGQYFDPYEPKIPGIEDFCGLKLHCHHFRDSSELEGIRRLAVVGAGPSGWDLAVELSDKVEKIYLLARAGPKLKKPKLHPHVELRSDPVRFSSPNRIHLSSGDEIEADGVIFCTGYEYSFPFLTRECEITVKNHRVSPLFKHCVHIHHPSLFFIGVPWTVIPFPVFHLQSEYCSNVLSPRNGYVLPEPSVMLEDSDKEMAKRKAIGWPERYYHKMAELQFDYVKDLADLCGARRPDPVVEALYNRVGKWRCSHVFSYKSRKFRIVDSRTFLDVTGDGKEALVDDVSTAAF